MKVVYATTQPRNHATTPLPYKKLDGQGVHTVLVKFLAVTAENPSSILEGEFLNI